MEITNNINDIRDFISMLKEKPEKYLSSNSVSLLYFILESFKKEYQLTESNIVNNDYFFLNFGEFIKDYFVVDSDQNWNRLILNQCNNNESVALKLFFELFDLFYDPQPVRNSKKIISLFFSNFFFHSNKYKKLLGKEFESVQLESFDIIMEYLVTDKKREYDIAIDLFDDLCKRNTKLELIFNELTKSTEF